MTEKTAYVRFTEILKETGKDDLPSRIREGESLSLWTSMKVGGPADYFAEPVDIDEAEELYTAASKAGLPFYFLGNGTNIIVSDEGVEGLVIRLGKAMSSIWKEGEKVCCTAGTRLSELASFCEQNGLAGLEFAYGIPGTVGGAILMNAGAYGSQISDVLCESTCFSPTGGRSVLSYAEHAFGYRSSIYISERKRSLILSAAFSPKAGDPAESKAIREELQRKRISSQPLDLPSAGSAFKRPPGRFAGTLIQDAGLKGVSEGGAQVSEKHAGFIVNKGGATAKDIVLLMQKVCAAVKARSGVDLEPEPRFIGRGFDKGFTQICF